MVTLDIVKQHCKIDDEDELLQRYLTNAISYAEMYQGKNYTTDTEKCPVEEMSGSTEQAILLLVAHYYDNREASDYTANQISQNTKTMNAVRELLYFERMLRV